MSNPTYSQASYVRSFALILWAVFLSAFTIILGAAPLRVLRTLLGKLPFFLLGVGLSLVFLSFKLVPLALCLFLFTFLVLIYAEFRELKFNNIESAYLTIFGGSLLAAFVFLVWSQFFVQDWRAYLSSSVEAFLGHSSLSGIEMIKSLNIAELISQLPSIAVIVIALSVALMVITEERLHRWSQAPFRRSKKLTSYSMPAATIWVLIFSLFGAFYQYTPANIKPIFVNSLNILSIGYFFQGIAIVSRYFEFYRVRALWRLFWMTLLVTQFFIFLAVMGVMDYWLDFRKFFTKNVAEPKRRDI